MSSPSPSVEIMLEARGLTRSYRMGGRDLTVLSGADLTLYAGERLAIMGRSGAGKSTLLHLLGLLDRPDSGSLAIRGQATERLSRSARARVRNNEVGFVFQFYHLIPELSALENVLLASMICECPLRWLGNRKPHREHAANLLDELGLAERLSHKPPQLSGGERQRVAIARALASRPALLLCDEPTGNLDERTSAAITNLLFEVVQRHQQTLVMVTHDPELARRADRTLLLHEGRLTAEELVLGEPAQAPVAG